MVLYHLFLKKKIIFKTDKFITLKQNETFA